MPAQLISGCYTAHDADLSSSTFRNVKLEGACFQDVNLKTSQFADVAFTGSTIRNVCFGHVAILDGNYDGMTIDGILATDLLSAYESNTNRAGPHEIPERDVAQTSLLAIARSVFLAWEKLRIAYLILLALITVLLTGVTGIMNLRLLRLIVLGAVVANLAYYAGPAIETYVRWLGYNRAWPRWGMFIGGTLISIVLAIGVLATELLPDQP
jgi:uncharacterized protein YjbI with pentapeptide repeats